MSLAQIARFRPAGPWRLGPDSGAMDRVDRLMHSDSLYSAVTLAIADLGRLEEWLDATARAAEPAVRFTSAYPFHGDTLFAPPPMSCWPPAPSPRIRWKGARFVPMQAVVRLLRDGGLNENDWIIDAESECLIPVGKGRSGAPFRIGLRSGAAVDRITGAVAGHSGACLEFAPGAGFWMAISYANTEARSAWSQAVTAALRLLGDTGLGGERSRGWGRSESVDVRDAGGVFAAFAQPEGNQAPQTGWWLLSLFSPADAEHIDWTRGAFATLTRTGRTRSGDLKRGSRMIAEGSVLISESALRGVARDVAPSSSQHPVYRWGAAFAVPASVAPGKRDRETVSDESANRDREEVPQPAPESAAFVSRDREGAPQPPAEPTTDDQTTSAESPAFVSRDREGAPQPRGEDVARERHEASEDSSNRDREGAAQPTTDDQTPEAESPALMSRDREGAPQLLGEDVTREFDEASEDSSNRDRKGAAQPDAESTTDDQTTSAESPALMSRDREGAPQPLGENVAREGDEASEDSSNRDREGAATDHPQTDTASTDEDPA